MADARLQVEIRGEVNGELVTERELARREVILDSQVIDLTLWWYSFDGVTNHTYLRWIVNGDNDDPRSLLVDPKLAWHAFTHPLVYGVGQI